VIDGRDFQLLAEFARGVARCYVCGRPATCVGRYEGGDVTAACDEHCGHGCEDGRCVRIVPDEDPNLGEV
jgi:hypothetical protein